MGRRGGLAEEVDALMLALVVAVFPLREGVLVVVVVTPRPTGFAAPSTVACLGSTGDATLATLTLSLVELLFVASSSNPVTSSSKCPLFGDKVFHSHPGPAESHLALHPAPIPSTAARGSSSSLNCSQLA